MQPDLFASMDCDHLPVDQRKFIDGDLVCTICNTILRAKE
jgi:hypothetical protein